MSCPTCGQKIPMREASDKPYMGHLMGPSDIYFQRKNFCEKCLRWINEHCTETTIDTKLFPNCFLKK